MRDPNSPKTPVGLADRNATTTTALLKRIGALERAARARDTQLQDLKAKVGGLTRDIAALRRERRTPPERLDVTGTRVDLESVDFEKILSCVELPPTPTTWYGVDLGEPGGDRTAVALVDAAGVCEMWVEQPADGALRPSRAGWRARLRQLGAWLFRSKSCGD